jgi:hypothetical protein
MPTMTQPWLQIVARYDAFEGEHKSIRALGALAQRISQSPLANGLHAWTSMFDLCIVQIPVSHPFHGPFLRISPITEDRIEFRYVDTFEKDKQWHRIVDTTQTWSRLIRFLDQLRWFPADVLQTLNDSASMTSAQGPR